MIMTMHEQKRDLNDNNNCYKRNMKDPLNNLRCIP